MFAAFPKNNNNSIFLFLLVFAAPVFGQVSLRTSLPSPQPVGTPVNWIADAAGSAGSGLWYRFRVREPGGEFRMIRDFAPDPEIEWTSAETDGSFEMEVAAKTPFSDDAFKTSSMPFTMTSRAVRGPAVSPTKHPLVTLYSAPPCAEGESIRVVVLTPQQARQATPRRACVAGKSINFYLAGLRENTGYSAFHEIENAGGAITTSDSLNFQTGLIPSGTALPIVTPFVRRLTEHPSQMLLMAPLFPNLPAATDLEGQVLWYYPGTISVMTRAEGGRFWGLTQSPGPRTLQKIREFDLTGMTLRETNAERINEQLRALGKRQIGGFHHEVRTLPDGRILVLATAEEIMTDVQGPGEVNVVGDVILVLDANVQVVWTWYGFDHLDPRQAAILDEKCSIGSCPPIYLAAEGNDWTHANSAQLAADGSIIVSVRHLDTVIKVNYANGSGDGAILWTLGKDGDFFLESTAAEPWFSHQHDAALLPDGTLLLFDNGNVRHGADPSATSRGQIIALDESSRSARLLMNADLGAYHFALGSAHVLAEGTFHFGAGWILPGDRAAAIEVDGTGAIWYSADIDRPIYRSFRILDLYTAQ